MLDEAADDVVGVVGVANGIGATEEHLEADIGDGFAERCVDSQEKFLHDFVAVWNKVMNLDRFDISCSVA